MDKFPERPAKLAALVLVPLVFVYLHGALFPSAVAHTAFGDPDYGYLLNSLLLVDGKTPVHIDHPGTMVQMIGAAVIRARHALGHSALDATGAVLSEPYEYLRAISRALLGVLCFSSFLFGLGLVGLGFSLPIALIGETAPFWLPDTWTYLVHVSPEVITPAYCLAIALLLLRTQTRAQRPWDAWEGAALGTLLGAGLALKMTFAPLLLLLLLPGLGRARWLAWATVGPAFTLLTFPIWSQYPRLFQWLEGIALHRDVYGLGATGVVPTTATLAGNFQFLWNDAWPFFLLLALIPIAAATELVAFHKGERRLLPALAICSVVLVAQLLIVVKQVGPRYLLPSIAVWAWLVPSLLGRLRALPWNRSGPVAALVLAIVAGAANAGRERFRVLTGGAGPADQLSLGFLSRVAEHESCLKIYAPPVPLKVFSLYSGDLATNATFTPRLQELYPGTIFYDIYPGQFRSFGQELSADEVKRISATKPCTIIAGSSSIRQTQQKFLAGATTVLLGPVALPFELETLYEENFFGIYRVVKWTR